MTSLLAPIEDTPYVGGTANSYITVDVNGLQVTLTGIDGELLTWSSAGVPATVAAGSSAQVLTSNGAGSAPTFQAAAGGDVTKVGTPVDNQVGVWTGDGTIEGDADLTFDGTGLVIGSAGSGSISVPGAGTASEAFGAGSTAVGNNAFAFGNGASAGFNQSISIGEGANATSSGAVSIGRNAAAANVAISIGNLSDAAGSAVAIGSEAQATGGQSIAIGTEASATSTAAIVIGNKLDSTTSNQVLIGHGGVNITDFYLGRGVTYTAPTTLTINGTGGSGTDVAGATVNYAGGKGTGTGAGGDINFQVALAGAAPTVLNTLVTVGTFSDTTTAFNVTAPASMVGVNIDLDATPGDAFTVTDSGAAAVFVIDGTGQTAVGHGTPDRGFHVEEDSAATATVTQVARLTSTSTGTPANGIGVGLECEVETAAGNNEVGATIETVCTDVTAASEDFAMSFLQMVAGSTTLVESLRLEGAKLGFYGVTTVVQPTALTSQDTSITHTAPGTPDFAIQDLIDSGVGSAFGFATKDEGNTVLQVILNLQTRIAELETKLQALGLLA